MRIVAVAIGCIALAGIAGVSQAGQETQTAPNATSVFDVLHQLEKRESFHRAESRRLQKLITRGADSESASTATAARRASRRVAARVAKTLGRWELVGRASRAHRLGAQPGVGERLRRVLQQVERRDLGRQSRSIDTWRRLQERSRRPHIEAGRQAQLRVQLAQHTGAADAAETSKRDAGKEAAGAEETEDAVEAAQERLSESMDDLVDYRTGEDFHRRKGALLPPVDDEPSVGYGKRKRDESLTYVRHTGLSYDVEVGHPVRAVAEGRVVHAERFEGFGRLIIIAHGDTYHSLYAHLSDYAVDVGDDVKRGDTVGKSGESGSLRGPTLYFELRRGGVPLNPEPWFIRTEEEKEETDEDAG
jgi:murein DD-endopeptidase MepM/ murein hydrolase activator NlpD